MIQLIKVTYRSLSVAALSVAVALPALSGTALADAAPAAGPGVEVPADVAGPRGGAREGARISVVGEVGRYIVGPLGHVRGFVLKDGTAVMVPGTAGDAMAKEVPVGQSVRVEGWSPRSSGGKAVMRAAVYGQHGQVVTPAPRHEGQRDPSARRGEWAERRAEMERLPAASANGTVEAVVPGHHGKPAAVLLTNGMSVFLRPGLARAVSARGIRVGDRIESVGRGATYPLGASVIVGSITFGDGAHFEAPPGGEARPR